MGSMVVRKRGEVLDTIESSFLDRWINIKDSSNSNGRVLSPSISCKTQRYVYVEKKGHTGAYC